MVMRKMGRMMRMMGMIRKVGRMMRRMGRTFPKEDCQVEENKADDQVGAGPTTRSPKNIINIVVAVVVIVVVAVIVIIIFIVILVMVIIINIIIIIIIIGAWPRIRSHQNYNHNPLKSKREMLV